MPKDNNRQALTPDDSAAFEAWVIEHKRSMADFARQRTRGNQDKADDAVQNVLLKFGRRIAEQRLSFAKLGNIKFTYKAIKNQLIDNHRKEQLEANVSSLDETVEDEEGNSLDSATLIEASETRHREELEREELREFEQAVEQKLSEALSKQQEEVFRLRYEGHSFTEIAERLRISEDRVRKDYDVAKKNLKARIRQKHCPKANKKQ